MNSFIPWIGGKSQLRKKIVHEFPDDAPKRYVEVFGGAGWILFSKEKHASIEIFNDIDSNLINLYRCIQYHLEELQKELRLGVNQIPPNSRELFEDYKAQLSTRGLTDIQRAARYFYVIRVSYGARKASFGCNKKILLNSIDRLPEIQNRLKDVLIENLDFEHLLRTYNKPDTLFYLDPPYYKAESFYDGFSPDDHHRLFDCVGTIQNNFILSYNDAPEIRELYKDYKIIMVERANNLVSNAGVKKPIYKELIIKNF